MQENRITDADIVGFVKVVFRGEAVFSKPLIFRSNHSLVNIEKQAWDVIRTTYYMNMLCRDDVFIEKEYTEPYCLFIKKQTHEIFREGKNKITKDFKPIPKIRS